MRIHYDHGRDAWRIDSELLYRISGALSRRVWVAVFVVAYLICAVVLIVEVARWVGGW